SIPPRPRGPAPALGQTPAVLRLAPDRPRLVAPPPHQDLVPISKNFLSFITSLPPAQYWRGPIVDVDAVIATIHQLKIDLQAPPPSFRHAIEQQQQHHQQPDQHDHDHGGASSIDQISDDPKPTDVYRARRAAQIKKQRI
ncbi:MAG: hypothetical protein Q8P67_23410, partial [archaeon]|nr:hypothetical protein [archaeon]